MARNSKPTLVMGASGTIGASIVQKLLANGRRVRVSSRNPKLDQFPGRVEVSPPTRPFPTVSTPRSRELGRCFSTPTPELEVTESSRAQAGERFARFMPAEEAEAVLRFVDDAAAGNSPATSTVPDVLGLPALDFAVWAGDHVNDFR